MDVNNKKNIILAIDSSSSISGIALFVDGELKEFNEIEHNSLKTKKLAKEYIDLNQTRMQNVIDKLLMKYAGDFENVESIKVLIELPLGSYTNNLTYGRLCFYGGLWLGKITGLLEAMPDMMRKTQFIKMYGGQIAKYFKFKEENTKQQAVDKVKELYNIDLSNYKAPVYNQDGTLKRDKKGEVKYKSKCRHNAADAILLGYIFVNSKKGL